MSDILKEKPVEWRMRFFECEKFTHFYKKYSCFS